MQDPQAFVREIEVWTPESGERWTRAIVGSSGLRTEHVANDAAFRSRERLVARVVARARPELADSGGEDVSVGLPLFGAQRASSVLVLRCRSPARRAGCIEIWEPNGARALVHAEGYYGALASFELSSRLARFECGVGLPGIAWETLSPCLIDDVRTSSAFLRTALAREASLEVGLSIPMVKSGEVTQVLALLTAQSAPVARAIELWAPDAQGRMWLSRGVYAKGLEAFARASRTTCLMRGEGVAGRASSSGEVVLWSRYEKDGAAKDADASRAGLVFGAALPVTQRSGARVVLVLRS